MRYSSVLITVTILNLTEALTPNRELSTDDQLNESGPFRKRSINIITDFNQYLYTDLLAANNAAANCHSLIQKALQALDDTDDGTLMYIFGDTSDETRQTVVQRFTQIDSACSGSQNSPIIWLYSREPQFFSAYSQMTFTETQTLSLPTPTTSTIVVTNPTPICSTTAEGILVEAWAAGTISSMILCDLFYSKPAMPANECWQSNGADIFIHELMHMPALMGGGEDDFDDVAYGPDVLQLPPSVRLYQPDAYAFYATHVWLGCVNGVMSGSSS